MSPRIAALLCALLVLTGCAANPETKPTGPVWTAEEAAYIDALLEPLNKLTAEYFAVVGEASDGPQHADARVRLMHLDRTPAAPASLAPVDVQRVRVVRICGLQLVCDDLVACPCLDQIDALRLELARLYAARGAYPPGYQP